MKVGGGALRGSQGAGGGVRDEYQTHCIKV